MIARGKSSFKRHCSSVIAVSHREMNLNRLVLSFFAVLVFVIVGSGCESRALGDIWTRPNDEMVMVYVPEGEFEMGSNEGEPTKQPVHTVALDGFWIDRTEVTNAQYKRCVEAGECETPGRLNIEFRDPAKPNHPMVSVDWFEAEAYCEWTGARLPSEAEWEYAARGPEARVYPWGDEFDGSRLNYCDTNCREYWADETVDDGYGDTAPVGSYPRGASWCDVLDMAGNAGEWMMDWLGAYPLERQENPMGPASGELRTHHGGAWDNEPHDVRSASRGGVPPATAYGTLGFRCTRDAD